MTQDKKHNIKLDEIEKKNIFSVPDLYFDRLPGVIQSKAVSYKSNKKFWIKGLKPSLQYGLPILVLFVLGSFWFSTKNNEQLSAEDIISDVSNDDLLYYLVSTDISVDDMMESIEESDIEGLMDDESTFLNELDQEELNFTEDFILQES